MISGGQTDYNVTRLQTAECNGKQLVERVSYMHNRWYVQGFACAVYCVFTRFTPLKLVTNKFQFFMSIPDHESNVYSVGKTFRVSNCF